MAKKRGETAVAVAEPEGQVEETQVAEPMALTEEQKAVAESRKSLLEPLAANQERFESPEGFIIVAEKGKQHVWCAKANKGKGMFINPMR